MSLTGLYMHVIWTTRNRHPYLKGNVRKNMCRHIKSYAERRKLGVIVINGHVDHLHVLLRLRPTERLADMIRLIKGESSFWYNQISKEESKFRWQRTYWARTVSPDELRSVINYIVNQEIHHETETFESEWKSMRGLVKGTNDD